jgi:hypothetical protein
MKQLPRQQDLTVQEWVQQEGESGQTVQLECLLVLAKQAGEPSADALHDLKTRAWQNLTDGVIDRLKMIADALNPAVAAVPVYQVHRSVMRLIRDLEEG